MSHKILVTGSNGQLGTELKKISDQYSEFEFIFTDIENLDITNSQSVLDFFLSNKPVAIINCAAYTAVDKAESEPDKTAQFNIKGVKNLVEASKKTNAFILHVSTDFVFDGKSSIPYIETDKENPLSIYGKTKLEGEKIIKDSQTDFAVVRTSWLYSKGNTNFLQTMLCLGSERQSINVVFDQIGTPTAASDLAETLLIMLRKKIVDGDKSIYGIFHYSNEGVCSWYDFAVKIMKLANLKCKVYPILTADYPTPAKRPPFSVLDKSKIKKTLGINILHWEESLVKVIS